MKPKELYRGSFQQNMSERLACQGPNWDWDCNVDLKFMKKNNIK